MVLARNMEETKKEQRLFKKAETFLNDGKDNRKRTQSLQSFMASASEEEQKLFFQQNYHRIYSVMLEAFSTAEGNFRQKAMRDKEATQEQQKEMTGILRILERIFYYLPDLIRKRWQCRSIVNDLSSTSPSPWTAAGKKETPLENTIIMMEFLFKFMEEKVFGGPSALDSPKDSTHFGTDVFTFLFNIFRNCYLSVLYPDICNKVGIRGIDNEPAEDTSCVFDICLTEIQEVILPWFSAILNGDNRVYRKIQKELYRSWINVAIINEVLRQASLMPFPLEGKDGYEAKARLFRIPTHTYSKWTRISKDSVPGFMYSPPINMDDPPEALEAPYSQYLNASPQSQLRLFIENTANVFFRRSTIENLALHEELCRSVLAFYQALTIGQQPQMTPNGNTVLIRVVNMDHETWDFLLIKLLEIIRTMFGDDDMNRANRMKEATLLFRIDKILLETLFRTWIRANIKQRRSKALWAKLLNTLSHFTKWGEIVAEWKETMIILTRILGYQVYKIDLNALPLELAKLGARSKFRDRGPVADLKAEGHRNSRLLTSNDNLPSPGAPFDDSMKPLDVDVDVNKENLCEQNLAVFTVFRNLEDREKLEWTDSAAMFMWKNMLGILGNINNITEHGVYADVMDCLLDVHGILYVIWMNQGVRIDRPGGMELSPTVNTPLPIFECIPWVLEACEMPDSHRI
eukprot:Ihof_evm11s147 gene=Ihof_evmTU11s147